MYWYCRRCYIFIDIYIYIYIYTLKQNDDMVCFRDLYPAAPHHFLVIPRQHIVSCLSLTKQDAPLGEWSGASVEVI